MLETTVSQIKSSSNCDFFSLQVSEVPSCQDIQNEESSYLDLMVKNDLLQKKNDLNMKKINNLKIQMKRKNELIKKYKLNLKQPVDEIINQCKHANENTKEFCKMLLKKKQGKFNEHQRSLAISLNFKSPCSYKYMRDTLQFKLPSDSSIYKWTQ